MVEGIEESSAKSSFIQTDKAICFFNTLTAAVWRDMQILLFLMNNNAYVLQFFPLLHV